MGKAFFNLKIWFYVGWSEARSPTAVVSYASNVGLRTSLQPTKDFYDPLRKEGVSILV